MSTPNQEAILKEITSRAFGRTTAAQIIEHGSYFKVLEASADGKLPLGDELLLFPDVLAVSNIVLARAINRLATALERT